jgi:hypothetical protein
MNQRKRNHIDYYSTRPIFFLFMARLGTQAMVWFGLVAVEVRCSTDKTHCDKYYDPA